MQEDQYSSNENCVAKLLPGKKIDLKIRELEAQDLNYKQANSGKFRQIQGNSGKFRPHSLEFKIIKWFQA
jgi:hypothetical protein